MILTLAFFLIALLYACVGQAGGAGYIAVLGLAGFGAAVIKPASLALTVLLAAITSWRLMPLAKARDWYPFALLGVPASLLGGAITLPGNAYRLAVALLLFGATVQMMWSALRPPAERAAPDHPPFLPALASGGAIGIVSGVIGIGGGIFVAPLMLMLHWADTRRVMAVSAIFNLCISAAGFAGVAAGAPEFPEGLPWWAAAVAVGGVLGAWLGARHLPDKALRLILAAVLLASAVKLALP